MTLAVLGMGRMGQALAGRLLDCGHSVTIWNRTARSATALVERGAAEARSIADAVGGAALVLTSLANDDAVRAVVLDDDDGVAANLAHDATYVETSTVSPSLVEELAATLRDFVAMPVLGPPSQVSSGEATYLVGADDAHADAVAPLFPGISGKHLRYERPSLASVAKLTVNSLLLNGVVALAEAFAAGRTGGLSDEQLRALLADSPMVAPGLAYRFEGVLTGEQEPIWTTPLGLKDAGLVTGLAGAHDLELPLTATARDQYAHASSRWEDEDVASVAKLYSKR
ncbi:MAG: NAD(P)-dependent oxidoreductase [Acidimicrobiales bacterium]